MLHGSPSSPEYVINSDQAQNMLENLTAEPGTLEEPVIGAENTIGPEGVENVGANDALSEKENRGEATGEDDSGLRGEQDGTFGQAGTAQGSGQASTVLNGINKIITQISAMINEQALTNSQLVQAVSILSGLNQLGNLVTEVLTSM